MKRVAMVLFSALFLISCSQETLYRFKKVEGDSLRIDRKELRLLAFFVNEEFSWYGEADRFYGKFYTIQPVVDYFSAQALARLGINFRNQRDYALLAKELGLEKNIITDRKAGAGHLVYRDLGDYYPFLKKTAENGELHLVVENHYEIIMHGSDNRAGLLTMQAFILDHEGEIVWSRAYSLIQPLSADDYRILVSYQDYNRNQIQKRAMELYGEAVIRLGERLIMDLKNSLGNN